MQTTFQDLICQPTNLILLEPGMDIHYKDKQEQYKARLYTRINYQVGFLQDKMELLTQKLPISLLLIKVNNSMEMLPKLEFPNIIQAQPLPQQDQTTVL